MASEEVCRFFLTGSCRTSWAVIVNGARDVVDVDDERDVCVRRARVKNGEESLEGHVERVRVR